MLPAPEPTGNAAAAKLERDADADNVTDFEYAGIDADDFRNYAKRTYENGLPPLAVGQKVDDKPPGKVPWHRGHSGRTGVDADLDEIDGWPDDVVWRMYRGAQGILNLGMRKPIGGIGIDVDDYVAADGRRKHGLRTIAEHAARLGPLPPTWRLSARPYDTGSGIKLYRVPEDWEGRERLKTADGDDGHVELIQRHHRHSLIPPSIRPDLGDGVVVRLLRRTHWRRGIRRHCAAASRLARATRAVVSRFG